VIEKSFEVLQEAAGQVSRETFQRVLAFEQQFLKWAGRINLSAPSTLGDTWTRHILDSAQLARIAPKARRWLDVGSGGGFPGAIIALLLMDRDGASIDLVESNRKKAAFLQATLGQLKAPARIHARRIEDSYTLIKAPEVMTARALAPLPNLLALSSPWLGAGATGLFNKGRDYRAELKESVQHWSFDLVEHRSIVDPDSVVLEIRNLQPRGRSRETLAVRPSDQKDRP
jgi:16S rRNA (guanine527-N7)-methyltransferase